MEIFNNEDCKVKNGKDKCEQPNIKEDFKTKNTAVSELASGQTDARSREARQSHKKEKFEKKYFERDDQGIAKIDKIYEWASDEKARDIYTGSIKIKPENYLIFSKLWKMTKKYVDDKSEQLCGVHIGKRASEHIIIDHGNDLFYSMLCSYVTTDAKYKIPDLVKLCSDMSMYFDNPAMSKYPKLDLSNVFGEIYNNKDLTAHMHDDLYGELQERSELLGVNYGQMGLICSVLMFDAIHSEEHFNDQFMEYCSGYAERLNNTVSIYMETILRHLAVIQPLLKREADMYYNNITMGFGNRELLKIKQEYTKLVTDILAASKA